MLRFASYFVPDERCWAPTIEGGTPCVPPSEQLPLGMFSWWQHGGARIGGANDPHKPSSGTSKLVEMEKLVDTSTEEKPGGLRYTPCPCTLGGACRLFSAVEAAELQAFVTERLRSSRSPSTLVFRDELPYNETGKLLRRVVREDLRGADS